MRMQTEGRGSLGGHSSFLRSGGDVKANRQPRVGFVFPLSQKKSIDQNNSTVNLLKHKFNPKSNHLQHVWRYPHFHLGHRVGRHQRCVIANMIALSRDAMADMRLTSPSLSRLALHQAPGLQQVLVRS